MSQIHPTAVLEGDVTLADDVTIGPHCVVTGPVTVGAGTTLVAGAYLQGPLEMGSGNVVYPGACIGFAPQHARYDHNQPGAGTIIGDDNKFREGATVHRAYTDEPTRIGSRNYFMSNSHAGHDAIVGDDCTFVNMSVIAGHGIIGDRVLFSGSSGCHQFTRVGTGAMLAGLVFATRDVPPWFLITKGNVAGAVNMVGLKRSGASREDIDDVRFAFRTICRESRTVPGMVKQLETRSDRPMIQLYLEFIEKSTRSFCTSRGNAVRGTAS